MDGEGDLVFVTGNVETGKAGGNRCGISGGQQRRCKQENKEKVAKQHEAFLTQVGRWIWPLQRADIGNHKGLGSWF